MTAQAAAPMPHSEEAVRRALKRLFVNGPLTQLPRFGAELEMLLALAHAALETGGALSEPQVNERLKGWLATFCAEHGVDHVTFRRYLADLRFLIRDVAGTSYRFRIERARQVLDPRAMALEPGRLLEEVRRERSARKQARRAGAGGAA